MKKFWVNILISGLIVDILIFLLFYSINYLPTVDLIDIVIYPYVNILNFIVEVLFFGYNPSDSFLINWGIPLAVSFVVITFFNGLIISLLIEIVKFIKTKIRFKKDSSPSADGSE